MSDEVVVLHNRCTEGDCLRKARAMGLCESHYGRLKRERRKARAEAGDPTVPLCSEEGCESPVEAKGMCQRHYYRLRYQRRPRGAVKPRPAHMPVPDVVADCAWDDVVRGGPTGQKLVLYTCPECGRQHLVAWLPIDLAPGLKSTTCRALSAPGMKHGALVNVLAPEPEGMLDAPPSGYEPRSKVRLSVADVNAAVKAAREAEAVEEGFEQRPQREVRVA